MKGALLLVLIVALPLWWRETSSHASARRGARAYEQKKYTDAAKAYKRAGELAPSPRGEFNAGTAEIAAGMHEQGAARLGTALSDPSLRADAYFNRGNAALGAKALDHAVADYIQALRSNPRHEAARRNLEIALRRRESERRAAAGGRRDQKGESKPQPAPGDQKKQQPGQMDLEALLRSVQQQEQEELRRMKGKAAEGRVGW